MRYFDTGVLLKLYLAEPRAADAVKFVNSASNKPPFTELHRLEMRSALRQKQGRGNITVTECQTLLADLQKDVSQIVFQSHLVSWPDVPVRAEALLAAQGAASLCRLLDTLH